MNIIHVLHDCSAKSHLPFLFWGEGIRATTGELQPWNCLQRCFSFSSKHFCGFLFTQSRHVTYSQAMPGLLNACNTSCDEIASNQLWISRSLTIVLSIYNKSTCSTWRPFRPAKNIIAYTVNSALLVHIRSMVHVHVHVHFDSVKCMTRLSKGWSILCYHSTYPFLFLAKWTHYVADTFNPLRAPVDYSRQAKLFINCQRVDFSRPPKSHFSRQVFSLWL